MSTLRGLGGIKMKRIMILAVLFLVAACTQSASVPGQAQVSPDAEPGVIPDTGVIEDASPPATQNGGASPAATQAQPPAEEPAASPPQTYTVEMSESGYSPETLTIKAGDTVTFVNMGNEANWPATDTHPTHRLYPGSDIKKCGTGEQSGIFDACMGLMHDQQYSFTFTEKGNWEYHNHLRPVMKGTIIVE